MSRQQLTEDQWLIPEIETDEEYFEALRKIEQGQNDWLAGQHKSDVERRVDHYESRIQDWEERGQRIKEQIGQAADELRRIADDTVAMSRLHEIEQMMVRDCVGEIRHLKCEGCLRMMEALIDKARGA